MGLPAQDEDREATKLIACAKVRELLRDHFGLTVSGVSKLQGVPVSRATLRRWTGPNGELFYRATTAFSNAFMNWARDRVRARSGVELPMDYIDYKRRYHPNTFVSIERPHKIDLRTLTDPFSNPPNDNWKTGPLAVSLSRLVIRLSPKAPCSFFLKKATLCLPDLHPHEEYRWLYVVQLSAGAKGWLGWKDDAKLTEITSDRPYTEEVLFRVDGLSVTTWQGFLESVPHRLLGKKLILKLTCLFDTHEFGDVRIEEEFSVANAEIVRLMQMALDRGIAMPRYLQPMTLEES